MRRTTTKPSLPRLSPEMKKVVKQELRLERAVRRSLSKVLPDASQDLLSVLAIDLADFWEIGEIHRLRVQKIKKMSGVRDREKLARLLTDLVYGDVFAHLPYHTRRMKRVMPVVIEKIERGKKLTSVKA